MESSEDARAQFAPWLRRQLQRRGWNAAELSRRTGLASGTISRWLNGQRTPRDGEHIHLLAQALALHQDEILERLEMRDGTADHMSLAVRRLSPVIDRYDWSEEALEQLARVIDSVGRMYAGTFDVPNVEG